MKNYLFILLCCPATMLFSQINLCSGGSGTTSGVPQSYNESREADVTVISSSNIPISYMKLGGFCTGSNLDSGFVGARIYDSGSQALLYSYDTVVHPMYNGTVLIPVTYTLLSGQSYRLGFYCYGFANSHNSGSAYIYIPTFPYNESNNLLRINQAYESASDAFPTNVNLYIPFITLGYTTLSVNVLNEADHLQIYPNPTSNQFTIETNTAGMSNADLYDVNGKHVFTKIFAGTTTLDVTGLDKGVYTLTLKNTSGVINKKLIIAQ